MTELFLVVDGRVAAYAIYGVYDTEQQAKEAIVKHDPLDAYNCYVVDITRNIWICPPVDI